MIIFVNHHDPHITARWNEFAVLNNLCQRSVKIWLINLVYDFVFAIKEMELKINFIVIWSSSVEEYNSVCSEVSIRWHHAVIVKMLISSLWVKEIDIAENKIEKMTLIIFKVVAKSKEGSKPLVFKVLTNLASCYELNFDSCTYLVYLIWKCNSWISVNNSDPLWNEIPVKDSVYLLKVCNLLVVVSKLCNVDKLTGNF
jgi:hypothetical protein